VLVQHLVPLLFLGDLSVHRLRWVINSSNSLFVLILQISLSSLRDPDTGYLKGLSGF